MVEWFTYPHQRTFRSAVLGKLIASMSKIAFMLAGSGKADWKQEETHGEKDFLAAYRANPNIKITVRDATEIKRRVGSRVYHLVMV